MSRSRSLAALCAVLFVTMSFAAPAFAQASEERLRALEQEVAALRAAVEQLKASAATAPATAALAELERRIAALAAELESLKLGDAAVEAETSVHGLGPAASKVYQKPKGVSIGGYGELVYSRPDEKNDAGADSGAEERFDLLRAILYFGYKWNDKWLFNSELEWEHAKVGEDAGGEAAVEFAYVDRLIRPEVNVRAGLVLLPVGLVNELHEPTVFRGVRRPEVERRILPSTWRENGVGLFGDVGGFSYRTFVVAGLDASGFSASGIRDGRQEGSESTAEDLAWVGRLDWTATPGLVAGGSLYFGDSGQGIVDPLTGSTLGVGTRLLELHADWKWRALQLRALWADAEIDDVAGLNRALGLAGGESVGESMDGFYVEAAYDLFARRDGDASLRPFLRFEQLDTQAEVPSGFAESGSTDLEIVTLGLEWQPFQQLVVKGDFQDTDNEAGTGVDQFNVALGWVF